MIVEERIDKYTYVEKHSHLKLFVLNNFRKFLWKEQNGRNSKRKQRKKKKETSPQNQQ